MFNRPFIAFIIVASLFASCKDSKTEEKEDLVETQDTVKTGILNVAGELFSVPSPIQTAILIQKSGIPYDKTVLSMSNKVNAYSTDYARSLNLGIYGADLGYVSLFNQTQDALGYLGAIKQLSDKLGISAAFDGPTIDRIKNNITNKDSMMVLVGIAYRGSDAYLKNNKRTDISSLILTGGWIESMYFSIAAFKAKPSDAVKFRIAEQKQALTGIVKILGNGTSEEMIGLTAMLSDLSKIYEGIEFKYTFVPPVTDSIKQITYINSTSEVIITEAQMNQIAEKVTEIRNKIVNSTQS
jgi:hypothetical protein